MKLDEIADDVGLDVNGEALLARGEQLVKLEVSFLHSIRVNLWNVDFNTVHFFLSLNGRKCGVKCELFFLHRRMLWMIGRQQFITCKDDLNGPNNRWRAKIYTWGY